MEDENVSVSVCTSDLTCRICLLSTNEEVITKPCNCSGTMALVHSHCLEKWISTSCRTHCELCQAKYNGKIKLKYGLLSSIPRYIWAKKNECGVIYCYVKIWLYLYVLHILLREYASNAKNASSSAFFTIFVAFAVCAGLFLFVYSLMKCIASWNRWRYCQFKFVFDDGLQQV